MLELSFENVPPRFNHLNILVSVLLFLLLIADLLLKLLYIFLVFLAGHLRMFELGRDLNLLIVGHIEFTFGSLQVDFHLLKLLFQLTVLRVCIFQF